MHPSCISAIERGNRLPHSLFEPLVLFNQPLKLANPALSWRFPFSFAENIPYRMRIQFATPGFREIEKIVTKPILDSCRSFKQKAVVFKASENLDQSVLIAQEGDFSVDWFPSKQPFKVWTSRARSTTIGDEWSTVSFETTILLWFYYCIRSRYPCSKALLDVNLHLFGRK